MTIELDHFFILTEPGALQAELLSEIGLTEGTASNHLGQGTANRRFFFEDTMLELLYVCDAQEAMNGPGSQLRLVDRAAGGIASPFGIIVRTASGLINPPFSGWDYHPDYFEADKYFRIGENSGLLEEPLCTYAAFELPVLSGQSTSTSPFDCVTELRISIPVGQPSSVLEAVAQCEQISFHLGEPHLMEVVFNDAAESGVIDLRPELPLIINW